MPSMRIAGNGHHLSDRARLRRTDDEYVVELDVGEFTDDELWLELLGRVVTVRAHHGHATREHAVPFELHERLEESFRLPDDAAVEEVAVHRRHRHLLIRVPRHSLEPRVLQIEDGAELRMNTDAEPY